MRLSPHASGVQGQSDYLAWLLGETRGIDRSFSRVQLLLTMPEPHQESWCQELAAVVMHWRIFMLDAQLRGGVPPRCAEFHRWYMGIVEMLTACGDALTCYIHRKETSDAEVVRRLALKRLTQAHRAWQELQLRLSALEARSSVAPLEGPQLEGPQTELSA